MPDVIIIKDGETRNTKVELPAGDQLNVSARGQIVTHGTSVESLGTDNLVSIYGSVQSLSGQAIILGDRSAIQVIGTVEGETGGIKIGAMEEGVEVEISHLGSVTTMRGAAISGYGKLAVDIGFSTPGQRG